MNHFRINQGWTTTEMKISHLFQWSTNGLPNVNIDIVSTTAARKIAESVADFEGRKTNRSRVSMLVLLALEKVLSLACCSSTYLNACRRRNLAILLRILFVAIQRVNSCRNADRSDDSRRMCENPAEKQKRACKCHNTCELLFIDRVQQPTTAKQRSCDSIQAAISNRIARACVVCARLTSG